MKHEDFDMNSVQAYCDAFGFDLRHPLVAVVDSRDSSMDSFPASYTARWGLYAIFLKQTKGCTINYGRTRYDYDDQSMVFLGPGQVTSVEFDEAMANLERPGFRGILFHPDLLFRTSLSRKIRQYTFFGYQSNEALHLSADERVNIEDCFERITRELLHPVDNFSKGLIVSNIELLLDYSMRYYSRQFIVREAVNAGVMARFDELLHDYLDSPAACAEGIPNVKYFAGRMSLSPNYFGDLVKRESGMTAQDYIQYQLLDRAKNLLISQGGNVSQTAYSLGFQYPQHFIRFFKRKTGQTPKEFFNAN